MIRHALSFFVARSPRWLWLALIAAFGRFFQVHLELATAVHIGVEIVVQAARVGIVLLVIGDGSIRTGIEDLKRLFRSQKSEVDEAFARITRKAKDRCRRLVVEILLFALLALVVNWLISAFASSESAGSILSQLGVSGDNSINRRQATTLFLKNVSVIPLTIMFQYAIARFLLSWPPFNRAKRQRH